MIKYKLPITQFEQSIRWGHKCEYLYKRCTVLLPGNKDPVLIITIGMDKPETDKAPFGKNAFETKIFEGFQIPADDCDYDLNHNPYYADATRELYSNKAEIIIPVNPDNAHMADEVHHKVVKDIENKLRSIYEKDEQDGKDTVVYKPLCF